MKKEAVPAAVPEAPPSAGAGFLGREEIEAREDRLLAPYAMRCARSQGRAFPEPEHPFRTAYMRDRDRVVHAAAFRRLEYKTQVFVNHEGDTYRTRLTHSMEVAQVARTAARALRLNEDLVEAVGLSHDVGHGPFGHAGETALDEAMARHGGFEHNSHGLRVMTLLERRDPAYRGLNLTHEVREAFALHAPHTKDEQLSREQPGFVRRRPLLEAQLVDVCDNLTYVAHDLDDGIRSGCVAPDDLCDAALWRSVWEASSSSPPGGSGGASLPLALRVSRAVKGVIDASVSDLLAATARRVAEAGVDSPDAVRSHPHLLVGYSEAFGRRQRELGRLLHERFYRHPRLLRAAARARRVVLALFDAFTKEPGMLDLQWRAWADEVGPERACCDWIASLTDREALDEYRRLVLPNERESR